MSPETVGVLAQLAFCLLCIGWYFRDLESGSRFFGRLFVRRYVIPVTVFGAAVYLVTWAGTGRLPSLLP